MEFNITIDDNSLAILGSNILNELPKSVLIEIAGAASREAFKKRYENFTIMTDIIWDQKIHNMDKGQNVIKFHSAFGLNNVQCYSNFGTLDEHKTKLNLRNAVEKKNWSLDDFIGILMVIETEKIITSEVSQIVNNDTRIIKILDNVIDTQLPTIIPAALSQSISSLFIKSMKNTFLNSSNTAINAANDAIINAFASYNSALNYSEPQHPKIWPATTPQPIVKGTIFGETEGK